MLDIWGHSILYRKATKEVKFIRMMEQQEKLRKRYYRKQFLYSFKRRIRFEKKKKLKKEFLMPRYLKYYYLILKLSNFRRFYRKSIRKFGAFDSHFLIFLECRLFMLAYRLNFVTNMFMIRQVIRFGIIHVNGKIKKHSNSTIQVGDIIGVSYKYIEYIRTDMILRFINKIIFWNIPSYFIMNYKFLIAVFWREPYYNDLNMFHIKWPKPLDIFIGSEYYYPRVS